MFRELSDLKPYYTKHYYENPILELFAYYPILQLPAVNIFSTGDVDCIDGFFSDSSHKVQVQDLNIIGGHLSLKVSALAQVLDSAPALKMLSIAWPLSGTALYRRFEYDTYEFKLLPKMPIAHGPRLEPFSLQKHMDATDDTAETNLGGLLQLSNLRSFSSLRTLKAPEDAVRGECSFESNCPRRPFADLLPDTLVSLTMFVWRNVEALIPESVSEMESALLDLDKRLPSLQHVVFEQDVCNYIPPENRDLTALDCEAKGARLPEDWSCEAYRTSDVTRVLLTKDGLRPHVEGAELLRSGWFRVRCYDRTKCCYVQDADLIENQRLRGLSRL